ncbi:unnamed protein product [Bursaphelenchus xylophilus]|uniref:(pine wood nematode) hypothetical protein n=1 Tax=Bursaphelenchus xylophilus TaxID=6326 RepID=A0A1I7SA95_BURXY|nr:unnamed protein product [Bursaphelenchus xylophilus]CAG9084164.1 unnamed protein product [Bursaphelenchus xylophilus]
MSCNISNVIQHFHGSLHGDDDVKLPEYLDAYEELSRFFSELGVVFGFVESDVAAKRIILRELIDNNKDEYSTVITMVSTECNDAETPREKGSRTLLRLHRALEFLTLFVKQIYDNEEESTSEIFRKSYDETLSRHHTWIIRKSVSFASKMVPGREQLLRIMFEDKTFDEAKETITQFLQITSIVYRRVHTIYQERNLLALP